MNSDLTYLHSSRVDSTEKIFFASDIKRFLGVPKDLYRVPVHYYGGRDPVKGPFLVIFFGDRPYCAGCDQAILTDEGIAIGNSGRFLCLKCWQSTQPQTMPGPNFQQVLKEGERDVSTSPRR